MNIHNRVEKSHLQVAVQKSLKETKKGIYLRSYHKRVASNAVKIYDKRVKGIF